jgi:hypothetical protein
VLATVANAPVTWRVAVRKVDQEGKPALIMTTPSKEEMS